MPLLAATLRCLERNLLIFLRVGFFFEPEGRGFESLPACQSNYQCCQCFVKLVSSAIARLGAYYSNHYSNAATLQLSAAVAIESAALVLGSASNRSAASASSSGSASV